MTVYEDRDDYGFVNSWDSEEYGSTGPRLACCTIRPYFIDWVIADEIAFPDSSPGSSRDGRRRLAEEYYGGEVDVFTPEEFRELFGYEPEKLEGEEEWFAQN